MKFVKTLLAIAFKAIADTNFMVQLNIPMLSSFGLSFLGEGKRHFFSMPEVLLRNAGHRSSQS